MLWGDQMIDYQAVARRNVAIAVVGIFLAAIAYIFLVQPWIARKEADRKEAAIRDAQYRATVKCVEANGFPINRFLTEDVRLIQAESNCTLNSLNSSMSNDAAAEAQLATCEYQSKRARIAHATGLCNQWALCSKALASKNAFNVCYSVFGPTQDESSSDDTGRDE